MRGRERRGDSETVRHGRRRRERESDRDYPLAPSDQAAL